MRPRLAALVLLPLPALGAVPPPPLAEGLPPGLVVDGSLGEWTSAPLVLGAAQQVAGPSPVGSDADLSARIRIAVAPEGLALAGHVRDDVVRLSRDASDVHADHVEVWLSLPRPEMPPVEFAHQFGPVELPGPGACDDPELVDPEAASACRTWWEEQAKRRRELLRAFTAQYAVTQAGVVRFGLGGTAGPAVMIRSEDGWSFEALVPASAFPRTSQCPLSDLRILIDLADADGDGTQLETFLSSSPVREFGKPETFHSVRLERPLRFAAWPELFERAVREAPSPSYQPGPAVSSFQSWITRWVGYQYAPRVPSPDVVDVDMSRIEVLGRIGDVELVALPASPSLGGGAVRWLISRRGRSLLDVREIGTSRVRAAPAGPSLRVLLADLGTLSSLGTGPCGGCPELRLATLSVDAEGRFGEEIDLSETSTNGEDITWEAAPDLSWITVTIEDLPPRVVRHVLDEATGIYRTDEPPGP